MPGSGLQSRARVAARLLNRPLNSMYEGDALIANTSAPQCFAPARVWCSVSQATRRYRPLTLKNLSQKVVRQARPPAPVGGRLKVNRETGDLGNLARRIYSRDSEWSEGSGEDGLFHRAAIGGGTAGEPPHVQPVLERGAEDGSNSPYGLLGAQLAIPSNPSGEQDGNLFHLQPRRQHQ